MLLSCLPELVFYGRGVILRNHLKHREVAEKCSRDIKIFGKNELKLNMTAVWPRGNISDTRKQQDQQEPNMQPRLKIYPPIKCSHQLPAQIRMGGVV